MGRGVKIVECKKNHSLLLKGKEVREKKLKEDEAMT